MILPSKSISTFGIRVKPAGKFETGVAINVAGAGSDDDGLIRFREEIRSGHGSRIAPKRHRREETIAD